MTSIYHQNKLIKIKEYFYVGGFFVFLLFLNNLFADNQKLIEFYDTTLFSQAKSRFSSNTNFPNQANQIYEQLELNIRANIQDNLFVYSKFKTEWDQFNVKRDNRFFFLNSLGVKYTSTPNINFKLGSLYLDYSPYLLKNYPWESDIFRGLEFSFDFPHLSFESFVANNGVSNDQFNLFDAVPTINPNIDRDYSTINLGNNSSSQQNQRPTYWYGGKITYKYFNNEIYENLPVTFEVFTAFLNEEYQFTGRQYLSSSVFQTIYSLSELNIHLLKYINLNGDFGYGNKKITTYSIQTNKFGNNQDFYSNQSSVIDKPECVKAGIDIPSILGNEIEIYKTSFSLIYDKLDQDYTPIYLDNPYQIRRSFDPDINIYSGRKGVFLIVRQFFLKDTSIGYGYKNHSFEFNDIVPFLDGGRAIEHQIRLEEDLFKYFHLKFVYQIQQAKEATFADGVTKMNAFYIHVKSDVMEHISLEMEFAKNLNYYKNFDQLAIDLLIWGL